MKIKTAVLAIIAVVFPIAVSCSAVERVWKVHDMERPAPKVVTPGVASTQTAPSDAIVLFDGSDLSEWVNDKTGKTPGWKVENGYVEVVKKAGMMSTRRSFGDCQLHIEWAAPAEVVGDGQKRGNSGVFFLGRYEVQVLDSYDNRTYSDGQAAAIYGQSPPLVNACRAPGEWQSYDIIFHAPVFKGGELLEAATVTVLHNGVLVQDHWAIKGTTFHKKPAAYKPHATKLPIKLQDHGNPMRFRNIWVREL